MQYMRKTYLFVVLLIAAFVVGALALAGCDGQSQQQPQDGDVTTTSTQEAQKSTWPGVAPDGVVAQNLTQTNIMVVFDASGSMDNRVCLGEPKIREASKAMKEFVKAVPSDANLGLYVFNGDRSGLKVRLGTNNHPQFMDVIKSISPDGSTPLESSMEIGYNELVKQAQHQLGYGRYILLVVTDGEADGGEDPTRLVEAIVEKTPVEVHAVGICMDETHSLRQPGLTFYTAASDTTLLVSGLKSVLAEEDKADPADFKF